MQINEDSRWRQVKTSWDIITDNNDEEKWNIYQSRLKLFNIIQLIVKLTKGRIPKIIILLHE